VITASELLHGVHRAQDSKSRTRRSALVEAILERFPILQADLSTAWIHSRIWAELVSVGLIIGPHDLPGVLIYGQPREAALSAAQALALRVVADRWEQGE
jgi:hypothetical protein